MAPGCFSQSTNNKESMSLKQVQAMTSPVKLQPTARAIRPSTPPQRSPNKRASIDSFEILEQTIMKQKRLTKLKNTDLRKKVLLKRTFDLICDIMDTENGFTDDDETEPATPMVSASSTVVVQEAESDFELELHDHSKMDEDEEEEPKLAELEPVKSRDEETDSQVLPRQGKRRASSDDEDEEETFFCESHSSDQQLNWRRSFEASAASVDLKIYSDDSSSDASASKGAQSRRTDHQRSAKRIRAH